MEYLIIVACVCFAIYFAAKKRYQTTVRAAVYLMHVDNGATTEEANLIVQTVDHTYGANHMVDPVKYVSGSFGGSQLQMIAAARSRGFRG
mgnify:CR=1 FL=1